MKKIKIIITLDMNCPDDRKHRSLKKITENIMNDLATNTKLIPWDQGFTGKFTVRAENETDHFTSWCLLEEIKEQADK